MRGLEFAAFITGLVCVVTAQNSADSLPIVDLGYELYRASDFNQTGGYYNFSNIRFAAPPIGELRFKSPVPPAINRSIVHDGLDSRICPQGHAPWLPTIGWITEFMRSGTVPNTTEFAGAQSNSSTPVQRDPRQNEDCLFLDVIAPQNVFENAGKENGAPVLVWIFGGGYGVGSKVAGYDPRSLFNRASSSEDFVFVAMNYRLGAFGFLAGSSFQSEGGTGNAGFHDQRLALEWVQGNIHLFGGDKNRVTVMGESAGGGSIMHQITAYGGRVPAPFQQAIVQSPGWVAYPTAWDQEHTFRTFLRYADVDSLEEARSLSSDQVMTANEHHTSAAPYGMFGFSPSIDGDFVTQDPKVLLSQGRFDHSVRVMVGHNANEGLMFTAPITDEDGYQRILRENLPSARPAVLEHISSVLYPPVFDGSAGYRNQVERGALTISEALFVCNARALADRAGGNSSVGANETRAYLFQVYPGLHGQDVQYTFYNPDVPVFDNTPVLTRWGANQTLAYAMQDWFTSFAARGIPESILDGLDAFPTYAGNDTIVQLSADSVRVVADPAHNERCAWWRLGLIS